MEQRAEIEQGRSARRSARETEQRRTDRVHAAVAALIGPDDARRMLDEIEAHDDVVEAEGAGAKLRRMQESHRGQQWLREHPQATWADIARARM